MKPGSMSFRMGVLALAGGALVTSGCVLVVGGDGRKADVEWATPARTHVVSEESRVADSSLSRQVESRIAIDSSLQGEDISVSSSGNVVTLHGRVSDVARLEHVMRVAANVPGVARVVSRLSVELEAG